MRLETYRVSYKITYLKSFGGEIWDSNSKECLGDLNQFLSSDKTISIYVHEKQ